MRLLVVAAYVGGIFALSSLRHPPAGPPIQHLDKIIHLVEYGGLGLLLSWWLEFRRSAARRVGLALLLGAAVGMADELYQIGVPGRDASVFDFAADMAGVAIGALAGESLRDNRAPRGLGEKS